MNLKTYLTEWDPKRFQQARIDGLLDTKTPEQTELPDWFIDDLPLKRIFNDVETTTDFLKLVDPHKSDEPIFDIKQKPLPGSGNIRFVITPDGNCCWSSDFYIHGTIILYMMLKGYIPMEEKFSNYNWSGITSEKVLKHFKNSFLKYFLCFARDSKNIGLAESYLRAFSHQMWNDSENEDINKIKEMYKPALNKLGVNIKDIKGRVEL